MSDQKTRGKQDKLAVKSVRVSIPGRPGTRIMKASDAVAFAQMLSKERQWPAVVVLIKQIIQQVPTYGVAWLSLFKALHELGDFVALGKAANDCLQKKPRFVPALVSLAVSLRMRGRQEEALLLIQKAQKLAPGNASIFNHLGIIQKELGLMDQALISFNRSIALGVEEGEAYWNRADLLINPDDETIADMQAQLKRAQSKSEVSSSAIQVRLHFALARAYEVRREYDLQFEHIKLGAEIKRASVSYDHAAEMARLAAIPKLFSPERLQSMQKKPELVRKDVPRKASPIFICGLPRSGTTLVEQILSSHSQVTAGDELHDLPLATMKSLQKTGETQAFPDWAATFSEAGWQDIAERYYASTEWLQSTPYFTDKNVQNHQALGVIHMAMPEAKMIFCQRNPLDLLWGCYRQLFADGFYFTYDQRELLETWQAVNQLMKYWQRQFPEKLFLFDYDALIEDQAGVTQQLLSFLGLPWEEACMTFHGNARSVRTLSSSQVRQPLSRQRQNQWEPFKSHLQEWIQALS